VLHDIPLSLAGVILATSLASSLLLSPAVVRFCQTKSTRLTAVVGGLTLALGVLFASFAETVLHLYLSFSLFVGEYTYEEKS